MTSEIHILLNLMYGLLVALSGANFPTAMLPSVLRAVSFCLPLSRSVAASKVVLIGGSFKDIYSLLGGEVLIGIIFVAAGYILLNITESIAKKKATLDFY